MIKIKFKKVLTACLVAVQIFSFAACGEDSKEKESSKAISNTAKATADSTEKPINTGKPAPTTDGPIITDPTGNVSTTKPVEPTVKPTNKPTATPTKVPTKEPTKVPTEKPTPEPTKDPQPTADPALYPDDWGYDAFQLPIKTDGKVFYWKNSRVMHTIPKTAPPIEEWYGIFSDEENDQLIFYTGTMSEGTYVYYAVVKGKVYKLSEGEIVSWSMHSGRNQLWWIEEDGIAKSVNVRSKKYNEVYMDAENVKDFINVNPPQYLTFDGEVLLPIKEHILLNVEKMD